MSRLSSDTLFHFTGSVHNLVSILSDEFYPRYALEDLSLVSGRGSGAQSSAIAIPMVCFCDIPLSQAPVHMQTYGNYAIGLTKEWGMRNGVAPVFYAHERSLVSQSLSAAFDIYTEEYRTVLEADPQTKPAASELGAHLTRIAAYVKPYEGELVRQGRVLPRVRFYDEREWRFVPPGIERVPSLSRAEYSDFAKLEEANQNAKALGPLKFEPSDIKYIVVATEAEILPMIRQVRMIKGKYSDDEVSVLCSRLVSAEQICRDF